MPSKDSNILRFKNFHRQLPVPFVIYADFEANTEKINSCKPNNDISYTDNYQKHTDCGYDYKLCVVITISIPNPCRSIEVRMQRIKVWKLCYKTLDTAAR